MSKKEKRTSIISSVSNWIKLMALIVLVAEVIILLAMSQTPVDSTVYVVYPIMMFLLLLVIIGAVIYDRTQDRQNHIAAISSNDKELKIDPAEVETSELTDTQDKFTSSLLGYEFELPSGKGWHDPRQLNYHKYIAEITMQDDIDEDAFRTTMITHHVLGPSFVNADVLTVLHGDTVVIGMDELTTTQEVEDRLETLKKQSEFEGEPVADEVLQQLREMANQTNGINQIRFNSKLEVWTFPRKVESHGLVHEYKLAPFFQHFLLQGQEPVETLIAEEDYIFWTTSNKLKYVTIEDKKYDSLSISRWYRLHRSDKFIYLISVQWSPEFDPTLSTWDELKKSFESFRIKK